MIEKMWRAMVFLYPELPVKFPGTEEVHDNDWGLEFGCPWAYFTDWLDAYEDSLVSGKSSEVSLIAEYLIDSVDPERRPYIRGILKDWP